MSQLKVVILAAMAVLFTSSSFAQLGLLQGTAFSYQGRLNDGNGPANGIYDFQFSIYDFDPDLLVAGPMTNSAVLVTNGMFNVTLDFGNVFNGYARFLVIAVRTNGASSFTTLSPRQQILSTPFAMQASNAMTASLASIAIVATNAYSATVAGFAGSAGSANAAEFAETAQSVLGTVYASQLGGTLALTQLPSSVITNGQSGVTFGTLSGNGSGLTNLSASQIGGTLSPSQLPSDVVTNGQSGVALAGTFTGNGFDLSTVTSSNYLYAYDTTSQSAGDTAFSDVTFNTNVATNGWTHTPGTSSFVCHENGIYLVSYTAQVKLITESVLASMAMSATLNGTTVPGSQSFTFINTGGGEFQLSRTFIYPISSGGVLKIRYLPFIGYLDNPVTADSTEQTVPSASITIVRIK